MSKLDAQKVYRRAYDRIVKLAEPIAAWWVEMQAAETEAVTLADQRIAALTVDDVPTADRLLADIRARQSRAADLKAMITRREGEIRQAVDQLWATEGRAVMLATVEDALIAKRQAKDAIEKLSPAWNRAQQAYSLAQQAEMGTVGFESDMLDQRNRAAFVGSLLFQLLGSGEASDYKPSWLQD